MFHHLKKILLANVNRVLGLILGIFCLAQITILWRYRAEIKWEFNQEIYWQIILNNLVYIFYLMIASAILLLAKKPKRSYSKIRPTLISLLGSFLPYILVISPPAAFLKVPILILIFSPAPASLRVPILIPPLLVFCGGIISIMGLLSLRKSFSITPEVRGLVISGIYSFVRHPMYLGGFISAAGVLLDRLSIYSLVVYFLWIMIQLWRARLEEKLLSKEYANYQKYCQKTAAFLPLPKIFNN